MHIRGVAFGGTPVWSFTALEDVLAPNDVGLQRLSQLLRESGPVADRSGAAQRFAGAREGDTGQSVFWVLWSG